MDCNSNNKGGLSSRQNGWFTCQLLWPLLSPVKAVAVQGAAHAGLLAAHVIMLRNRTVRLWFRDSQRDKSALSLTLPDHTAGIHKRSVVFKGQSPDIAVFGGERDFVHALGEPGVSPGNHEVAEC